MAVIFETDELSTDAIRAAIRLDSIRVTEDRDFHDAVAKDRHSLVVIGPSINMARAGELSEFYRVNRPALGIVVVREFIDQKDLRIAVNSGVRAVVASNDLAELQRAVSKSLLLTDEILNSLHTSDSSRLATTISFFGTKGGVGKTMLAVNTALALSQIGTNTVCIVDLDLDAGDVGLFLSQVDTKTLSILSKGQGALDQNIAENLAVPVSKKLDAVLSPSNPLEAEKISPERAMELVMLLRKMYDFVVIDTKGAFTELNLNVLRVSDHVYTVIAPDLTAVKDAKVTLKLLEGLGFARSKRKVILNMSRRRTGLKAREIETILSEEITFRIPAHNDALIALNTGWALLEYQPNNPISKVVKDFAKSLSDGRGLAEIGPPTDVQAPTIVEAAPIGPAEQA
jgi:pilus assembly protein CpaE